DRTALEQAVRGRTAAKAVLVLKIVRRAGEVRGDGRLQRCEVIDVHPVQPIVRLADTGGAADPDERAPARRAVELVSAQVPLPQAVVGRVGYQREALFASFELMLRAPRHRHVAP